MRLFNGSQEMARQDPSAGAGAFLAAAAFRSLADNSRSLASQQRFEAAYDRQYNYALTLLLKLHETPNPIQLDTETGKDDCQGEPNFSAEPEKDLTCNE
jgi:hypothetical protein